MAWDKKHLIKVDTLSRKYIENLFELADKLVPYSGIDKTIPPNEQKSLDICKGKKMNLWFGEDSTRTYGSFETAMIRLGGIPLKFDEKTSSIKKKESIEHTARILSAQCDILVDRHRDSKHIYRLAEYCSVALINGGNGPEDHPTQTLLDLYTMSKESGIDGKKIVIVGDLKYGRTTHSYIKGLEKFDDVEVHGISPPGFEMPKEHVGNVKYHSHVIDMKNLKSTLTKINPDYIYASRIQIERVPWYRRLHMKLLEFFKIRKYHYQINNDTIENLPNVKLMHALPIATNTKYGPEIATELDKDDRSIYFKEADNGIPIRMGIIVDQLGYKDVVLNLS